MCSLPFAVWPGKVATLRAMARRLPGRRRLACSQPEPKVDVPLIEREYVAVGCTHVPRVAHPRPAPVNAMGGLVEPYGIHPRPQGIRAQFCRAPGCVLTPLENIAEHVVEPVWVRGISSDGMRPS